MRELGARGRVSLELSILARPWLSLPWQRPTALNFVDFDLKTTAGIVMSCFDFFLFYLQSFLTLTGDRDGKTGRQTFFLILSNKCHVWKVRAMFHRSILILKI